MTIVFPAKLLPPDAVAILQRAAMTPIPADRIKAIETATEKVQRMYPQLFRKES